MIRAALSAATQPLDAYVVLGLRYNLAMVLLMQGSLEEAVDELTRLLADQSRALGATHPETVLVQDLLKRVNQEIALPPTQ